MTLGPFPAADAHLTAQCSCFIICLPPAYISMAIGVHFSPCELLRTMGACIIADGKAISCCRLLEWITLSATVRPDP